MQNIQSIINFFVIIGVGIALVGVGVIFVSGMKGATKSDVRKNYNEIVKNYEEIQKVGADVKEVFNKVEDVYEIANANKELNAGILKKQGEVIDILNSHSADFSIIKNQNNEIFNNTEIILKKIQTPRI